MAGLTDQASGKKVSGSEAIERAHQAWQESMLRQLDMLRQELQTRQPERLAIDCGGILVGESIQFDYWGQSVEISFPELSARLSSDGSPCSVYDTGMLLYYLRQADGFPLTFRWVGYRELPGGSFYSQAFQGYSGDRLARVYAEKSDEYQQAAISFQGNPLLELPGIAFAFLPLPRIRLASILYPGDEEFPARASVLFDAADSHYMPTDGLALLGAGLVGRLIQKAE
jgi:Domain of unknown function (DUF3786)